MESLKMNAGREREKNEKTEEDNEISVMYRNQEMLDNLQKMTEHIEELNKKKEQLHSDLEYSRNKENKLMYLIFKLHKRGYPVN